MSNSFNLSVKPEIAAVAADIAAAIITIRNNSSGFATGITTVLGNIATQNTDIKSVVDAIADPQLPAILTAIGDNETKIDSIIAVPHPGQSAPKMVSLETTSTSFVDLINIADGSGFLTGLYFWGLREATEYLYIKITIDGVVIFDGTQRILLTGFPIDSMQQGTISFLHRFNTSILVEVKTENGSNVVAFFATYLEDE